MSIIYDFNAINAAREELSSQAEIKTEESPPCTRRTFAQINKEWQEIRLRAILTRMERSLVPMYEDLKEYRVISEEQWKELEASRPVSNSSPSKV